MSRMTAGERIANRGAKQKQSGRANRDEHA
jgi:hypothetical protein